MCRNDKADTRKHTSQRRDDCDLPARMQMNFEFIEKDYAFDTAHVERRLRKIEHHIHCKRHDGLIAVAQLSDCHFLPADACRQSSTISLDTIVIFQRQ